MDVCMHANPLEIIFLGPGSIYYTQYIFHLTLDYVPHMTVNTLDVCKDFSCKTCENVEIF